jgi:hypothetical protein
MVAIPHLSKLKSIAISFTRVFQVKKETYLSSQLRESAPYLKEAGFRQTATLLMAAAEEIETLQTRVAAGAERPLQQPGPASDVFRFSSSLPTVLRG